MEAIHLRAGDRLQTVNGEYVIVEQVQHEILEAPVKVYNFRVANNHTYYVGENTVGVHNNGGCAGNGGTGSNVPVKDRVTAKNGLDYKSHTKHTPGQFGYRPDAGIEPKNSLDLSRRRRLPPVGGEYGKNLSQWESSISD